MNGIFTLVDFVRGNVGKYTSPMNPHWIGHVSTLKPLPNIKIVKAWRGPPPKKCEILLGESKNTNEAVCGDF